MAQPRNPRQRGAVDQVQGARFPLALRGYERAAVDKHLADIAQLVAELEAAQLRESVVQKALDEVGEQTSGILQRAHETAEEIAARSRAQAEGRIQRAEREAELARREADNYAEQVMQQTRRLWQERRRLIEEMRQLAEDVLAVADDALERLPEPVVEGASAQEEQTQQLLQELPPQAESQPEAEAEHQPEEDGHPGAQAAQSEGSDTDGNADEPTVEVQRAEPGPPGRDSAP